MKATLGPPLQRTLLAELEPPAPGDPWTAQLVSQPAVLDERPPTSALRQVWHVTRRNGPGFCQLWDEVEARAVAACLNELARRSGS